MGCANRPPQPLALPSSCSIIQKGPKLADKIDNSKNAWISTCFGECGFNASLLNW